MNKRPKIDDASQRYRGIEINKPEMCLLGYTIFIFGPPKIGKTTAAASWPKPIVLACETGGIKAMRIPVIKIRCWDHLLQAIKELKKKENRKKYRTAIIDTADLMYKYCLSHCCEKYGFDHPSDQGWGKGWERIADEFLAAILKIFDLGYTLIFISHTKSTEIKADWEAYTRIDSTLPGTGRRVLLPLVDVILYMRGKESKKGGCIRTITTKATREYEAGDRTKGLTDIELKIPKLKKDKVYAILNAVFQKNRQ